MIELQTALHELQSHYDEITTGIALISLAMAFPVSVRKEVYKRQKGRCDACGDHFEKLQTHHRVPHSLGGSDTIDNAVGLCPQDHAEADRLAFQGIIYPQRHESK